VVSPHQNDPESHVRPTEEVKGLSNFARLHKFAAKQHTGRTKSERLPQYVCATRMKKHTDGAL
jgi:hypothetical protein